MREEKTLPEYLRELRRACRYNQDFVAARLAITRQTYSHYETGRIKPPAGKLYRLARLYGVPVERMLAYGERGDLGEEDCRQETKEGMPENIVLSAGWEEESGDCSMDAFLYHYRQLSEKDKIEIISLMKIKEKIHGQSENR